MPVSSNVPSDPDPTRAAIARAARWWWLGAVITVVVAAAYTLAASTSSGDSGTATTTVWADRPSALSSDSLLSETTDQVKAAKALPSQVTLVTKNDHIEVTITGSSASVQRYYDSLVELYQSTFDQVLAEKMAPFISRAQAQLDAAIARADEVSALYEQLPDESSAAQQLYLARYLSLEDTVSSQRGYLEDLQAQLERGDYLRVYPLAKDGKVSATSGGGVFGLAVGLLFGALIGGAAMLTLGALDRKVRRAADLAQADLGGAPVVVSRPSTTGTDGLLLSGAAAAAASVVVVSAAASVPDELLAPVRRRVDDVSVVAIGDLATSSDRLATAAAVLVVDAGTSTVADVERWIAVVQACSAGLVGVIVLARR